MNGEVVILNAFEVYIGKGVKRPRNLQTEIRLNVKELMAWPGAHRRTFGQRGLSKLRVSCSKTSRVRWIINAKPLIGGRG